MDADEHRIRPLIYAFAGISEHMPAGRPVVDLDHGASVAPPRWAARLPVDRPPAIGRARQSLHTPRRGRSPIGSVWPLPSPTSEPLIARRLQSVGGSGLADALASLRSRENAGETVGAAGLEPATSAL